MKKTLGRGNPRRKKSEIVPVWPPKVVKGPEGK